METIDLCSDLFDQELPFFENERLLSHISGSVLANKVYVDQDHTYAYDKALQNDRPSSQVLLEVEKSCRICLDLDKPKFEFATPVIDMLVYCFPFMESFVSNEHYLCFQCLRKLQVTHLFKHECLKAKEIFASLSEETNLTEIKEEHVNDIDFIHISEPVNDCNESSGQNEIDTDTDDDSNAFERSEKTADKISDILNITDCNSLLFKELVKDKCQNKVVAFENNATNAFVKSKEEKERRVLQTSKTLTERNSNKSKNQNKTVINKESNASVKSKETAVKPLKSLAQNISERFKIICDETDPVKLSSKMGYVSKKFLKLQQPYFEAAEKVRLRKKIKEFGKTNIQCPRCEYIFEIENFLKTHTKICKLNKVLAKFLHPCEHCDVALHKSRAKVHFKKIHLPFQCIKCKAVFEETDVLENHISNQHKYICEICPARQDTEDEYLSHMAGHGRQLAIREKVTQILRQQNLPLMNMHITMAKEKPVEKEKPVTKEKPVVKKTKKEKHVICHVCGKNFTNIKQHLKTHSNTEVKCKICHVSLREVSMKQHIRIKHKPKSVFCEICGKAFGTIANYRSHRQIHFKDQTVIKCEKCGESFDSKQRLYFHDLKRHSYKFRCELCDKTFSRKENFEKHVCLTEKKIYPRKTSEPYECNICHKVLSNKYTFIVHLNSHTATHMACKICGNKYKTLERLKLHMRYHEKLYVCDFCGLVSSSSQSLEKHKKVHKGDNPYRCNVCWAKFKTLEELNEHSVKHNNKKYKCISCGEAFNRYYLLKCHLNINHPEIKMVEESGDATTSGSGAVEARAEKTLM